MQAQADPVRAEFEHRYFKEPIETYGLSVPKMQGIVKTFLPRLKKEAWIEDVLELSELLLKRNRLEEG